MSHHFEIESFEDFHHQIAPQTSVDEIMSYVLYDPSKSKKDEFQEPNIPMSDASKRIKIENPINLVQNPNLNQTPSKSLNQSFQNQDGVSSSVTNIPSNSTKIPEVLSEIIDISDDEAEMVAAADGRIHSVPHNKHGPYTCPKCKNVFAASHHFEAHLLSTHYKHESIAEKNRRLSEEFKKRNLRIINTSDGITMVPDSSATKTPATRRRMTRKVSVKIEGGQVPKEGEDSVVGTAIDKHIPANVLADKSV